MLLIVQRFRILLYVSIVFQVDGFPNGIQYYYDSLSNDTITWESISIMDRDIINNTKTQFMWNLYKRNKTYLDKEDEESLAVEDTWDNINTLFVAIAATVSLVLLVGCPILCIKKNGKKENGPRSVYLERGLNPPNRIQVSTISENISSLYRDSPNSKVKRKCYDKPPSYDIAIHLAVIEEEDETDELPSYLQALELQRLQKLKYQEKNENDMQTTQTEIINETELKIINKTDIDTTPLKVLSETEVEVINKTDIDTIPLKVISESEEVIDRTDVDTIPLEVISESEVDIINRTDVDTLPLEVINDTEVDIQSDSNLKTRDPM